MHAKNINRMGGIQALARLSLDFVRVRKNFSKSSGAELPGEVAQKKAVYPCVPKIILCKLEQTVF